LEMHRSRKEQRSKAGQERFHPTVAGFKGNSAMANSSIFEQTMPMGPRQGERGNPAGRGSKGTVSEDGVEQEYIANLQKQVYFLELESKLLREKVNEKPPDGLDLPGPLDDHLLKLKQKYASLEAKLLAEKEELMEGMHRMKMQLDEAERVRKQLQSEVAEQSHFRKLAEQTLADDEENDRREFTELRQKIAIGKEEQRMLKAEMEGMRQKMLRPRLSPSKNGSQKI